MSTIPKSRLGLVVAAHRRDALQMISALEQSPTFEDVDFVLIEPGPVGRIGARHASGKFHHPRITKHIVRPITKHGTSLDGGTIIETKRLAVEFISDAVSWVAVGDVEGESSLVAQTLANILDAKIVVVPEGSGIFRAQLGGYPWVYRNWFEAIGLISHDTVREIMDLLLTKSRVRKTRKWNRRLRLSWRLDRVTNLLLFRPPAPPSSKINKVDLLVSWWPKEVFSFLDFERFEQIKVPWSGCEQRQSIQQEKSALFVHQPPFLHPRAWERVLSPISTLPISSIVIRPDRSRIGLDEFILGVTSTFPKAKIHVTTEEISSECLATSERFEFVVGFTSTVLVNLALDPGFAGKLVSLIRPLVRVNDPPERHHLRLEEMAWNFAPVTPEKSSRIHFVD